MLGPGSTQIGGWELLGNANYNGELICAPKYLDQKGYEDRCVKDTGAGRRDSLADCIRSHVSSQDPNDSRQEAQLFQRGTRGWRERGI